MPHYPKPFYKKSRGVFYVEINRTQINLGPDRDKAFERYHQLMAQSCNDKAVVSDSLVSISDAFLEWVHKNRAPDTYEWYRSRLQRFVEFYPDMQAADLRPYHVEQWVNTYSVAITTRRNYLRCVKRCLRWAKKKGYLKKNPIAELEIPAGESREVIIEQQEYKHFLSFVRNTALRDLIETTWETGCRPQESLRVEARHVDVKNRRWVFPKSESKMKRSVRIVYLPDRAFAITKRLMRLHPQGKLFRNTKNQSFTKYAVNCAFTAIQIRMGKQVMQKRGIAISEAEIKSFAQTLSPTIKEKGRERKKRPAELLEEAKRKLTNKKACQLAPRYCLYALRHAFCTSALKRGVDPLSVAILMGHQDPSTLAKVYQHLSLSPDHLLDQAKKAAG